ncbi:MAG: type II toxin-antitoxin system VapC family toxin [Thermoanaerobaculia bacterium]
MKRFIVDASVAVKWFVPEIHSAAAVRLLDEEISLFAPDLLLPELGNTVWKKMRRREMTPSEAAEIVRGIESMPVEIVSSTVLLTAALDLAAALDRTVYDCLYLALAAAQNCSLITADRKFYSAVHATGLAEHIAWVEEEL